ncbi:hypothetical protein Tco_1166837 [Tanacetum coccineum]
MDSVPPVIDEVASMMNVKNGQEESSTQAPSLFTVPKTAIPETSTTHATTVPPTITMVTPLPQLTTPSPAPTTVPTTTSIPELPNFSSLFRFDQRVSTLEMELSQLKKAHYYAQLLESVKSQLLTMKAQEKRKLYIDVVEKSVNDIIRDEVKSQLPQILPKEISDFATPVIQSTVTESLKNVVLAKSSSQPQPTYEAATSLTEFELKKILLDKSEKSKSYRAAKVHKNLYDALVRSYLLDKDLFDSVCSSKGTKSQSKSSGKSVQAEELVFKTIDTEMPQDQGDDMGNTEDQPNVEAASKHDWFKKPEMPPTLNHDWNARKQIDFRPPQTYISQIANIDNLTQQHLVGPTFNLLKGTCKQDLLLIKVQGRQVVPADYFINNDLEYLKGGSLSRKYITSTTKTKATKYDNIKGIEDMVKTLWSPVKIAYDKYALWGISHWGLKRQRFYGFTRHMKSTHDVYSRKRIIVVTHVKVMKKYYYKYLEEIEVRRDDNTLHMFKEGHFPNLNLRDIKDMLLLLVQKKISNLERDVIFDLKVALQIFTRSIVILKRVEDLQLGVESYQKKVNITKPETFRSDISKMTPYSAYKNPQGIIYQDKLKRNKLMRSNKLYKFCDSTLTSVRRVLHDIASILEIYYLPKRTWSKLDRKRSRIMIKAINQQLFERRLMRNLEKFVGGREYGIDFRLLERTI